MSSGDDRAVLEFGFAEFTRRLGLPPGATVTSIGMVWFDFNYGNENNTVRVHYRPGSPAAALEGRAGSAGLTLEDRLQLLAAKWRAQARHPLRRGKPDEAALLARHARELTRELEYGAQDPNAAPRLPREAPAAEQEGSHADYQD